MLSYLYYVFCENFHNVLALLCVLGICILDKTLSPKGRRNLLLILLCVTVVFLNNQLGCFIYFSNSDNLIDLRFFSVTFGYIFEPMAAFLFFILLCNPAIKLRLIFSIPIIANTIIFLQNVFTKNVVLISPSNVYVVTNDFLVCSPIIVTIIYFIALLIYIIVYKKNYSVYRFIAICIILSSITIATLIEKLSTVNILDSTIAICMLLFYLEGYISKSIDTINNQNEALEHQKNALLLSQIHPHFIYNTLNSIYYLCRNDSKKASQALLDFSNYLHGTLDASLNNDLVSFSQEIETTKFYTNLEKIRFENITVNYLIEEENFQIPPLSVQALVENSVRHGIRGKDNGYVTVRSNLETHGANEFYVITIQDNGIGICDTKNKAPDKEQLGKHSGMGMSNVKNRIEKLVNGTFEVTSSSEGTTVTITIPATER